MTERMTRKDAQYMFGRLCETLGISQDTWQKQDDGTYKGNIGAMSIDYNPTYGGVVIHEITSEGGGVHLPFTSARKSPAVFCECVRFALDVLAYDRKRR